MRVLVTLRNADEPPQLGPRVAFLIEADRIDAFAARIALAFETALHPASVLEPEPVVAPVVERTRGIPLHRLSPEASAERLREQAAGFRLSSDPAPKPDRRRAPRSEATKAKQRDTMRAIWAKRRADRAARPHAAD